jgi:hypothetical protein
MANNLLQVISNNATNTYPPTSTTGNYVLQYDEFNESLALSDKPNDSDVINDFLTKVNKDHDPLIKGFWYGYLKLPTMLVNKIKEDTNVASYAEQIIDDFLAFNIKSYSAPTITINTSEKKGLGGTKTHYATSFNMDKSITLHIIDNYNGMISKLFESWSSLICDVLSGNGHYDKHTDYKSILAITSYDPSFKEKIIDAIYIGIFPISVPLHTLNQTRNIELGEFDISLSFDQYITSYKITEE